MFFFYSSFAPKRASGGSKTFQTSTRVWLFFNRSFWPTHRLRPPASMYVRAKGTASAFCCNESGPLLKHLTSTVLLHKHVCLQDAWPKCRIQISSRKTLRKCVVRLTRQFFFEGAYKKVASNPTQTHRHEGHFCWKPFCFSEGKKLDLTPEKLSSHLKENNSLQDMKMSKLYPSGICDMFCEKSPPW